MHRLHLCLDSVVSRKVVSAIAKSGNGSSTIWTNHSSKRCRIYKRKLIIIMVHLYYTTAPSALQWKATSIHVWTITCACETLMDGVGGKGWSGGTSHDHRRKYNVWDIISTVIYTNVTDNLHCNYMYHMHTYTFSFTNKQKSKAVKGSEGFITVLLVSKFIYLVVKQILLPENHKHFAARSISEDSVQTNTYAHSLFFF